jgi:hypothetical protein
MSKNKNQPADLTVQFCANVRGTQNSPLYSCARSKPGLSLGEGICFVTQPGLS